MYNKYDNSRISRILVFGQSLSESEKYKQKKKKPRRIYRPGLIPKLRLSVEENNCITKVSEKESMQVKKDSKSRNESNVKTKSFNEKNISTFLDLSKVDPNRLTIPIKDVSETETKMDNRRKQALTRARNKAKLEYNKEKFRCSTLKHFSRGGIVSLKINKLKCKNTEASSKDESDYDSDIKQSLINENVFQKRKVKLTFIPKKKRKKKNTETFGETEMKINMEEKKRRKTNRKKQIRKDVFNFIELQEQKKYEDHDMPDDDDNVNKEQEFELWKLREMKRLKRSQNLIDERRKKKIELDIRRGMTDDEIKRENLMTPKVKERSKMKFLQKYFHEGSFFVGDNPESVRLLKRNFNLAVGSDKWINYDDPNLPKPMKVKNFGLASQTKYTHLMDQDTTKKYLANIEIEEYELNNLLLKRKNIRYIIY